MMTVTSSEVRWLAAIAVLLTFAACASPSRFPPFDAVVNHGDFAAPRTALAESLTVVSYNIQYGLHVDAALADLRREPRLRDADIYVLQEMDLAGTERMARELACDYVYYPASVHPHTGRLFGNAVLSRWPILATQLVILPHPSPLTGHQRIAVVADLAAGDLRLRVACVHLATIVVAQAGRFEQAGAVADNLRAWAGPVIVAGDFNTITALESAQVRRLMRRVGLREARLPSGATNRNPLARIAGFETVLDHIFYRGLELQATGIERRATASDHLPVWAAFSVALEPHSD